MGVQINGDTGNISATKADYSGNVTIGGTLTYEDVTNIDSVGLITARQGIEVGARPGVGASISVDGNAVFSGIVTASSFSGIDTDKISEGNTEAEVVDTGSDGHFKVTTEGTERIRVGPAGQIGVAGANYGTSGQVLKSQGSGSAVQWASVGVSTNSLQVLEQFYLLADGRSVSTSNGTVTTTNVTAQQALTDAFAVMTGSTLTYTPPTGTTEVIYEYTTQIAEASANNRLLYSWHMQIDGSTINESRHTLMSATGGYAYDMTLRYGFRVNTGGSDDNDTGDRAALSSMTLRTRGARWASSYAANAHAIYYYAGTGSASTSNITRRPYVGITAIGSLP